MYMPSAALVTFASLGFASQATHRLAKLIEWLNDL